MDLSSEVYKIKEASKAQQKYYILSQMKEVEKGTHLPSGMVIEGDLDIQKTKECFQRIICRHEALRTGFGINDENRIVQMIWNDVSFELEYFEQPLEEESITSVLKDLIRPFDLEKPPLIHVTIVKIDEMKYLMLTDIHHSISDGYSASIIAKEFMQLYKGEELEEITLHYSNFIDWMKEFSKSEKYTAKRAYWEKQIPKEPYTLDLPVSYPRPARNKMRGKTLHQTINCDKVHELKEYAKNAKCSLYMVLLAAFQVMLFKLTKQEELFIGTPVSVRENGGFDNSVGLFTNTMLLHNMVKEEMTMQEFINKLKINCAIEFSNNEYPFEELAEHLPYDYPMNRNPLFDIMFIYENAEDRVNKISNLICKNVDIDLEIALFDLTFELIEEKGELHLNLYYNRDLFAPELVKQWIDNYMKILQYMMGNPTGYISDFVLEKKEEGIVNHVYYYQVIEQIQDVLGKVTGNREIDVDSNFFEMGIRSIHAMQIVDQLYENYKISITDLFKYPTIASLAGFISGADINEFASIRKEVEKSNAFQQEDIAIIGMSCNFPKSKDINEFWDNLEKGNECITFFTDEELRETGVEEALLINPKYVKAKGVLDDVEYFDSSFFDYSPNEAEKMDPQIRVLHECAWKAIEDAGYCCDTYDGNIGVFVGGASNYTWTAHTFKPSSDVTERMERISLNDKDYFSTRISYKLNLKGPSYSIQTACSTSLTAINLACESLLLNSSDMVLTGGVSVMLPQKTGYIYQDGMIMSEDGHCRVFDEQSNGTVFSDGIGLVVLKKLSRAIEDQDHIYAVIKSVAVNNDGNRKVSYTAPSIIGQAEVIQKACQKAGVSPDTITYVETHGTGTRIGDPIEIEGLKTAYPSKYENTCAIGSLKSNMGHLDAAAGVAGVIKVAMAMQNHKIPATINYVNKNKEIHFEGSPFYINTETIPWKQLEDLQGNKVPRRAGISSFGFGGTNAHAILEEPPKVKRGKIDIERETKLIVLSAKTQNALERMVINLKNYLVQNPEVSLSDMAYTLQVGRKEFGWRAAFCASSASELVKQLEKNLDGNKNYYYHAKKKEQLVFMFSGQGSQYVHMAKDLYEKEAAFREEFDNCCSIIHRLNLNYDMKSLIYPSSKTEETVTRLKQTYNAQMAIFVVEYCVARMLLRFGIKPDALIGHSLGEYVAACISGVFSLEDGLWLISQRAKLMQKVQPGKMLALSISEEEVLTHIKKFPFVDIATINAPNSCVVSGTFEAIGLFEEYLLRLDIEF